MLLILAGVSISLTLGNNGVLNHATNAISKNRKATAREEVQIAWASATSEYWSDWASDSGTDKEDYFTAQKLTTYTGGENGTGTVTGVDPNGDGSYVVYYTSNDQNKDHIFLISEDGGNILEINGMPNITELRSMYGKEVSGYTGYSATDIEGWQLLYVDEHYKEAFIISTNGVGSVGGHADEIPNADNYNTTYTGSNSVALLEYGRKYNGLWLAKITTEKTYKAAKLTAAMCDSKNWLEYKGNKAKYAVGGPTVEILIASRYNVQVDDFKIEGYSGAGNIINQKVSENGYSDAEGGNGRRYGWDRPLSSSAWINPGYYYEVASPDSMHYLETMSSGGYLCASSGSFRPTVCLPIYALEIVGEGANKTLKIAE